MEYSESKYLNTSADFITRSNCIVFRHNAVGFRHNTSRFRHDTASILTPPPSAHELLSNVSFCTGSMNHDRGGEYAKVHVKVHPIIRQCL